MTATFTPAIASSTLSGNSKAYYRSGWKVLSAMVLEDGRRLEDLRLDCISTELADGLALPGSGSNQNMALRTLRRALSMALEKKQITMAPRVKLRKEHQRTAIWDAASEAKFLSRSKGILRDVFIMIQDSGMRPEEVLCLRARDVLWDKNLIYVPEGKTKRSTRHVPLSERMQAILSRRSKVTWNEYLFPAKSKTGYKTLSAVDKPFRHLRQKLGLDSELVLYSCRHTFASDLLDRTGNIKLVGDLLGHASVTTTSRYVHPSLKAVAGIVNERNVARQKEVDQTASYSTSYMTVSDLAHAANTEKMVRPEGFEPPTY